MNMQDVNDLMLVLGVIGLASLVVLLHGELGMRRVKVDTKKYIERTRKFRND